MSDLIQSKATICVVNYRTPELIRLCLSAVRRFTMYPHDLVVVDNDSQDASLEYLRQVPWIRLIERRPGPLDGIGAHAHGAALDLALAQCRTEFFVSLHSDTIITRESWLENLIRHFDDAPDLACVGTGKIEVKPQWQVLLKKATDLRGLLRKLLDDPAKRARYHYFIRTICSVYRTDILRREGLSFGADEARHYTVGQKLYFELLNRGYRTVALSQREAGRWVVHLAHATVNANAAQFGRSEKDVAKHLRRHIRALRRVRTNERPPDVPAQLHPACVRRTHAGQ